MARSIFVNSLQVILLEDYLYHLFYYQVAFELAWLKKMFHRFFLDDDKESLASLEYSV